MAAATPESKYLIEQLKLLIKNPESISHDDPHRVELERLTRLASISLETPQESMHRYMFTFLPLVTARISNDFNILTTLTAASDANPVALADLVAATTGHLDKSLVSPIMDYHCYAGVATEPRQGFYAPTQLAHNMTSTMFVKAVTSWHDILGPAYQALHRLLKSGPEKEGQKTAFQVGQHTTGSFYEWLEARPEQHAAFYGYMGALHTVTEKWIDVVDFDGEIAGGAEHGDVVFVDVGGGDGSQCIEVGKAHKLGGKTILQDRAAVIEKAVRAKEAGVEAMVYDFFTEQPVKNARAYFIQFVLLNWDNEDCVRILKSQGLAMGKDSVLMIVDYVQGHRWERKGEVLEPDLYTPAVALSARACHDAKGRSREDYRELLERAGLQLTEVRIFTNFGQAVIMAKKP